MKYNFVILLLFVGILAMFNVGDTGDAGDAGDVSDRASDTEITQLIDDTQDFRYFNSPEYDVMIDNLNEFFIIYDHIMRGTRFHGQYYQMAESKKNNAINALHSIIFNTPSDKVALVKLNKSYTILETILNKHLNTLYSTIQRSIIVNGYDTQTKIINIGPKEANHYSDKDFTYQFY